MDKMTFKGMKFDKSAFLHTLLLFLSVFVFSCVIYVILNGAISSVHIALSRLFPESVSYKNAIEEPLGYRRQVLIHAVISAALTIFISSFIPGIASSKKRKIFFNCTSGLISLKEGRAFYMRNFLLSDILAVLIVSAIFTVIAALLPISVVRTAGDASANSPILLLGYPFLSFIALTDVVGPSLGLLTGTALSLLGTLISVPLSVRLYRAAALVHSVE